MNAYYSSLARQLAQRAARATLSDRTPSNAAFREYLRAKFEQEPGNLGSFLGQPVFEALFEYEGQPHNLEELGLLHPTLIESLDNPPGDHRNKRFPKTLYPYRHQVNAWNSLKADPARSAIVSTGTASGKTECFLMPILDDLVREQEQLQRQLVGVRALFLYPLNALINSQRERLAAWTAGMRGNVRFCLYNGATPERRPPGGVDEAAHPEEVMTRRALRASPPPILVTNATMLEYMLVRNVDQPIIAQSRGHLRWIVLDEAHTYLGSNAAEVALLLRRVMDAFQADPSNVHFVATSATIGDEGSTEELRRYLADLAGVALDRVDVVTGGRVTPELGDVGPDLELPTTNELSNLETFAERQRRLAAVPRIRELRHALTSSPMNLTQVQERIGAGSQTDTLEILDYCSEKPESSDDSTLLPLRGHFFMRTQPGVWACWNPECRGREEELNDESWPFGAVYFNRRERCEHCESLVLEVLACKDCGEVYLSGEEDSHQTIAPTPWIQNSLSDEFDIDLDEDDDDEEDDQQADGQALRQLICSHDGNDYVDASAHYNATTGEISREGEDTVSICLARRHDPDQRIRCVTCGAPDSRAWQQFRSIRLGGPFYLGVAIPTLLSHAPPHPDRNTRRPRDGRQMITFTDSRQGTARFASRMELEASRNYVRSWVYHKLWSVAQFGDANQIEEVRLRIQVLRDNGLPVEQDEMELARLEALGDGASASVPWNNLVADLQQEIPVRRFIPDATRLRYESALVDPSDIARMFLYREFARRPRSGNSTETLGMAGIHFPEIDRIAAPQQWVNRCQTAQAWRDYLKICIDYFIRLSYCTDIPDSLRRWMGIRFSPKVLLNPDFDGRPRDAKLWPSIQNSTRRENRPIRILRLALGLNREMPGDAQLIDDLLRQAWRDLTTQTQILPGGGDAGRRLDLTRSEIRLVSRSYRCPVTQKFVDTVLNGVSPYHDDRTLTIFGFAEEVELPQLPFPFGERRDNGDRVSHGIIEQWLAEDPIVADARALGVWTEFSDRIAEFYHYFETAEHSGQLSKSRLEGLEDRFRSGRTNLLSCSTTMEMGIDIGGLTSVAMNNAPPGPANWLQRAGRAGRRDIAQASTLTLCQNQPHGRAVFNNTLWPFETPVHVPNVALNSSRIVQRHVQAFLLGRFFNDVNVDNATRLTNEWLFLARDDSASLAEQFNAWLEADAEADQTIVNGINQIVRRSILESESIRLMLDQAIASMREVAGRWLDQRDALVEELERVGGEPENLRTATGEQRALGIQLRRLDDEYLLKELAGGGFLPAHGFPLNVLPFVNTSVEQIVAEQQARDEGGDNNRFTRRSYPSRQLAMAIREYAPGNGVVIDGLSYLSSGLTLHWRVPPTDEEFREPQALLGYWWCDQCGFSVSSGLRPESCESCGNDRMSGQPYIKPSGFAVDIRRGHPNNNEDEVIYVPPTEPRLTCRGDWISMPNPALGRFRYDNRGRVFHHSKGANGFGYAVCLRCGRASSETGNAEDGAPVVFQSNGPHERLRSGRRADDSHICPGSDGQFTIRRNLWLGGEDATDVFQLRLQHPGKPDEVVQEDAAVSIAIALRTALAQELGVENQEIGWAVQTNREGGVGYRDIYLYDIAAGGAGYVSAAGGLIDSLISSASDLLSACNCDRSCHSCLLDFQTQRYAENLDRHQGLAWLDAEFLAYLQVPDEFRAFGDQTRYEANSVSAGMLLEMQRRGLESVALFVGGDETLWDVDSWPIWRNLARLSTSEVDVPITILLPRSIRESLSWHTLHSFLLKAAGREIDVLVCEDACGVVDACQIAGAVTANGSTTQWGVFDAANLAPGARWGAGSEAWPIIKFSSEPIDFDGERLQLEEVVSDRPDQCIQKLISTEFDGNISDVGSKFWNCLRAESSLLDELLSSGNLRKVTYVDRYIRTPLHARTLLEILNEVGNSASSPRELQLEIQTVAGSSFRSPSYIHDNWQTDRDQATVLRQLFDGFNVSLTMRQRNHELRHARFLVLEWDESRIEINLDQGVGFFRTDGRVPFDFTFRPHDQAIELRNASFSVRHAGSNMPIYIINS
jgi:ATP-dependent helicase YprA (DUF1998 family)